MKFHKLTLYALCVAALGFTACSDDEPQPVAVESVTLDSQNLTLETGKTATLTVTILPENATDTTVIWSTSNAAVATVSPGGLVTAVAPGEAVVTAKADSKVASCTVVVTPPFVAPNVGDYYYSDGTWSPEVDDMKMIIGVVFWTGDPTAQDPTLRADHPDCTHGLVIGLEQEQMAWQPAYEACKDYTVSEWVAKNAPSFELPRSGNALTDPLQKIIGYNNTKAIEAFNAAAENAQWPVTPVKWLDKLRRELPAPLSSSDWYIPSPKELSLLACGEFEGNIYVKKPDMTMMNTIMERMTAIGEVTMAELTLWSSTENYSPSGGMANELAWNQYFEALSWPLSPSLKSWSEYARVRAVLAF